MMSTFQNYIQKKPLVFAASVSFLLALLKLIGFIYSGSLILLASLFDSLSDTASSLINNFIHKKSLERADKEHPFGHGGFEVIGALIQGLLISFFAASLLIESVRKIFTGSYIYTETDSFLLSVGVLIFSAIGGLCIHLYLDSHVKKMEEEKRRSLALLADKAHYSGDVFANLGSAAGLLCVYLFHLPILDPLIGGLSSIFLFIVAVPVLKKTFKDIAHNEAPEEFQQIIVNVAMSADERIKGIHLLRSRQLGPHIFVDFHMKLPDQLPLVEAHKVGEHVESEIKKALPNADVFIHLDPESEPEQEYWSPAYTLPES